MIKWKLSETGKEDVRSLFDYPVKAVAALGALNNDPDHASRFDSGSSNEIAQIVVVNLNRNNGEVDAHVLNMLLLEAFWYKWLDNLKRFWLTVIKHE